MKNTGDKHLSTGALRNHKQSARSKHLNSGWPNVLKWNIFWKMLNSALPRANSFSQWFFNCSLSLSRTLKLVCPKILHWPNGNRLWNHLETRQSTGSKFSTEYIFRLKVINGKFILANISSAKNHKNLTSVRFEKLIDTISESRNFFCFYSWKQVIK